MDEVRMHQVSAQESICQTLLMHYIDTLHQMDSCFSGAKSHMKMDSSIRKCGAWACKGAPSWRFVCEWIYHVIKHLSELMRILNWHLEYKHYNLRCINPVSVDHIVAAGLWFLQVGRVKMSDISLNHVSLHVWHEPRMLSGTLATKMPKQDTRTPYKSKVFFRYLSSQVPGTSWYAQGSQPRHLVRPVRLDKTLMSWQDHEHRQDQVF